jgi:GDPmannose 4,6-dehydratase
VSFETPEYTANSDAVGTLRRVLEAIRILGLENKTRFYQASTSEMFGKVQKSRNGKRRRSIPVALWCRQGLRLLDYRELSRGLWAVCLQRHPLQPRIAHAGETFVSRKITRALARIKVGLQDSLHLGKIGLAA